VGEAEVVDPMAVGCCETLRLPGNFKRQESLMTKFYSTTNDKHAAFDQ
jgi:hypothetical protein